MHSKCELDDKHDLHELHGQFITFRRILGGSDLTNWGSAPGGVPLRPYFGWKRMQNMMIFFILLKTCLRQSIRSIFTVVGPSNIFSIFSVVPPPIFFIFAGFFEGPPPEAYPRPYFGWKKDAKYDEIFYSAKNLLKTVYSIHFYRSLTSKHFFDFFRHTPPYIFHFCRIFGLE